MVNRINKNFKRLIKRFKDMLIFLTVLLIILSLCTLFLSDFEWVYFCQNMYLVFYLIKRTWEICDTDPNFITNLYSLLQRAIVIAHKRNFRPSFTFQNILLVMHNFVTVASNPKLMNKYNHEHIPELLRITA